MKKRALILIALCFIILTFPACGNNDPQINGPEESQEEISNQPQLAPDFTAVDGEGNTIKLSDYRGNVVFLNFWGTWCPPCRSEMPEIQKVYEKYKDQNVVILGMNVQNQPREKTIRGVEAWVEEQGYTFPIIYDEDGSISAAYGIQAFPTTFIIDAEGYVHTYVIAALNEEIMSNMIETAMETEESE